jgi:hypothetical protein
MEWDGMGGGEKGGATNDEAEGALWLPGLVCIFAFFIDCG